MGKFFGFEHFCFRLLQETGEGCFVLLKALSLRQLKRERKEPQREEEGKAGSFDPKADNRIAKIVVETLYFCVRTLSDN